MLILPAVALVSCLVLAGCGASKQSAGTTTGATNQATATTATTPTTTTVVVVGRPVPLSMQRAIARHAGKYAYAPTWMPPGYGASTWRFPAAGWPGLEIHFLRNGDPTTGMDFTSGPKQYRCPGGRTVWLRGGNIYWSGNNEGDQYAWTCTTAADGSVVQFVIDANPSNRGFGGPSVRTLGRILHSVRQLR